MQTFDPKLFNFDLETYDFNSRGIGSFLKRIGGSTNGRTPQSAASMMSLNKVFGSFTLLYFYPGLFLVLQAVVYRIDFKTFIFSKIFKYTIFQI